MKTSLINKRTNRFWVVAFLTLLMIVFAGLRLWRYWPYGMVLPSPSVKISPIACQIDKDSDGLDDLRDILAGAKAEVRNKPQYRSAYYQGGYPPESEGVCTDVVGRALMNAGYDLRILVDKDIRERPEEYSRLGGQPDSNIDFRGVANLLIFFNVTLRD